MRIVLIACDYPPARASGAQRAGHVARTLRNAGMDVRVITARPSGGLRRDDDESVTAISPWPSGADVLGAVTRVVSRLPRGFARGHVAPADPPSAHPDPLDPGPPLRRILKSALRFPDARLGFLPPAVHAALDPAHPPPDAIYTTGPPVTAHLTGLALHALGGPAWVDEYRDPWLLDGQPVRAPSNRSAGTDACERWLEARCMAAADEVVTVSAGLARELAPRRKSAGGRPPIVIRNGIPELLPGSDRREPGPRRVLYLGNLYGFRDPRAFFDGLAAVCADRGWGPQDIAVDFVGSPPPPAFVDHARRRGLSDVVRFADWIGHAEGQARVLNADLLLLFAQKQPLQVPNKLYEYLGSRKPILAFADHDGETAGMLRRAGAGEVVTETDGPDRVRAAVARALDQRPGVPAGGVEELLASWTTASQMRRLPDIVRRAVGRASSY